MIHAFALSLMIKISQSVRDNLAGYCKNRIFPFLIIRHLYGEIISINTKFYYEDTVLKTITGLLKVVNNS